MKLFPIFTLAVVVSAIPSEFRAASAVKPRIIGGQDAIIEELPFQLSIQNFGSHICGASLLSDSLAVTSAKCIDGLSATLLSLACGVTRLDVPGQNIQVEKTIIHPNYDASTRENDIALLVVSSAFELDSNCQPIQIPREHSPTSGDLMASGWGLTSQGGTSSNILQKVTVPFVSDASCRKFYSKKEIFHSMLCAGLPGGGKDICPCDSGGPLVSLKTRNLVGIASWDEGCGRPNRPGVYTEVSFFTKWINEHFKIENHL